MGNRHILACALCLAACAPVSTSQRILETPRDGGLRRDPPQNRAIELRVVASADHYLVTASDTLSCIERRVTIVERVARTKRRVNKPITVLEYLLGLGIGAAGGVAIVDPDFALDQTGWGEMPRNDLNRENMQKAGAGAAGVGALFLTFGIINSFRGGTSERKLPDETRSTETGRSVACGTEPRDGDEVALSVEGNRWPLGKTTDGKLTIPWSSIPAETFDGAWRGSIVTASSASAPIDLSPVRAALAEREWSALAAAPSLEGARRFQTRFSGIHDAETTTMIVGLADQAYAPIVVAALARANLEAAKQTVAQWRQDTPDSALVAAHDAEIAELERRGPADYLHVKYEAAMAGVDADPSKLDAAERTVAVLSELAPSDPRVAAAQKATSKKRAALTAANVKLATRHAGQARSHARHGELAKAEAALALAVKLAPDHKDVITSVQYVESFKAKAAARAAGGGAEDKARLAIEAKAKADEERAERQRLAAAAKALVESERVAARARREQERADQARLAAEAKAKREADQAERTARARAAADAERARVAEENAKAGEARARSAEEKAKAREATREATAERARLAAEARARERAEAAKASELARAERAERAEKAKAELARLESAKHAERAATADKVRASERARRGGSEPVVSSGPASAVVGLWASMIGSEAVWLVELRADGGGRTAVWSNGHLVGFRAIAWRLDGDVLALSAGASALRSAARTHAGQLSWAGVHWKRQ